MQNQNGNTGVQTCAPTSEKDQPVPVSFYQVPHVVDGPVTAKRCYLALEQQEFKCALSGVDLEPSVASIDHIIPIASGGTHTMQNIHFVHAAVNRMKATASAEEFVLWCMKISDHARGVEQEEIG